MPAQRLNKVIDKLEKGETVFGSMISNGNLDQAVVYGDSDFDMTIIEMEHSGFDIGSLRMSLQAMMNRSKIARDGLQADVVPLARIPTNAGERNQWIIKQTLDSGVYGIVVPHLETPDEARALVQAVRYPRPPHAPLYEPPGQRGLGPMAAARYWGLSVDDYVACADVWPLDRNGELLLIGIIESVEGVRNLPAILDENKGIGAIWPGTGDLSVDMGVPIGSPAIEAEIHKVIGICKDSNVACLVSASDADTMEKWVAHGVDIVLLSISSSWKTAVPAAARSAARTATGGVP